jgi:hypothetical protein
MDYEIEQEIKARYANNVCVEDYQIYVSVKNGNVVLNGTEGIVKTGIFLPAKNHLRPFTIFISGRPTYWYNEQIIGGI